MLKIPRTLFEFNKTLEKAKALRARLEKGEQFLAKAIENRSLNEANDAIVLFNKLAIEMNDTLEDALFLHETLATGRTTVIDRKGRAVNTTLFNPREEKVVELFELKSIQRLKEVFGEENIVEFEVESE